MTNSNQKERFRTRIVMQEQNITVLQNKCEEYLGELDRTRKALDVAVDALNAVTATPLNSRVIHDVANNALEQITALEQKDK